MKCPWPLIAGGLVAVLVLALWPRAAQRATGALPQSAYAWQRVWNEAVLEAVSARARHLSSLVVLNAEVGWKHGEPVLVRIPLDFETLRETQRPVGLALRIGPFSGPFTFSDARTRWLADLATSLLRDARSNRLAVTELQIDFDCAESRLDGYGVWVEAIRRRVTPVPVTITALPAWLNQRACRRLLATADGYVLQVHSVERPRSPDAPFTLCRPDAARRAVEQAAQLRRPFRVALPTYGYSMAFDPRGRFIGLSAEGALPGWPEGTQVRELRADAASLASLVAAWQRDRPRELTGLIWYRLPVAGDRLNWPWSTLESVMAGVAPRAALRVEARRSDAGFVEVVLVNAGPEDDESGVQVAARWQDASLVAADGLHGFEVRELGPDRILFQPRRGTVRVESQQGLTIGWLRLSVESPVEVELESSPPNPVQNPEVRDEGLK
jgi:hypothetical protein